MMAPVGRHFFVRALTSTCCLGMRDYIHVVDLAKGHLAAMRRFNLHTKSRGFESYNLGTGQGTSVLELVKAFREASGMEIPTGSILEKVINNIGFSVHR